jgi:hypothetical protein
MSLSCVLFDPPPRKNSDRESTPREIDPIARPEMYPHFAHAVANSFDIAWVVVLRTRDASEYDDFRSAILQSAKPPRERFGLLDIDLAVCIP